jgi:hypothetical protein
MHMPDETTGETTSHPTKQPEDGCQVVGYSQSTDEATSQSTKSPNNGDQVAGYKPASGQVAGYDIRDERYAVMDGGERNGMREQTRQ